MPWIGKCPRPGDPGFWAQHRGPIEGISLGRRSRTRVTGSRRRVRSSDRPAFRGQLIYARYEGGMNGPIRGKLAGRLSVLACGFLLLLSGCVAQGDVPSYRTRIGDAAPESGSPGRGRFRSRASTSPITRKPSTAARRQSRRHRFRLSEDHRRRRQRRSEDSCRTGRSWPRPGSPAAPITSCIGAGRPASNRCSSSSTSPTIPPPSPRRWTWSGTIPRRAAARAFYRVQHLCGNMGRPPSHHAIERAYAIQPVDCRRRFLSARPSEEPDGVWRTGRNLQHHDGRAGEISLTISGKPPKKTKRCSCAPSR